MSLKSHALYHISIIIVLPCILDVCNFFCMSHVRAFPMHTYFFFSIYLLYLKCFGTFLIISLSLPLFLFTLVVSIAPNRKSTPSQNPFRSGTSSSSDPTLSHLQFRDDDAHKAFSENFSRCGIHSNAKSFWQTSSTPTFWCHSQSGMGVTVWCPGHLSSRAYLRFLLQHAWDWSFSTSFLHLRSRYAHSCHTAAYYGCALGS